MSPLNLLKTLFVINKLSKGHSKVILHSHLFPIFYLIPFFKFFKKNELIHTEHNVSNKRRKFPIFRLIEKFIYSKFSYIVSVSEDVNNEIKNWLGTSNNKNNDYKF